MTLSLGCPALASAEMWRGRVPEDCRNRPGQAGYERGISGRDPLGVTRWQGVWRSDQLVTKKGFCLLDDLVAA
jgi:hypothetical protein